MGRGGCTIEKRAPSREVSYGRHCSDTRHQLVLHRQIWVAAFVVPGAGVGALFHGAARAVAGIHFRGGSFLCQPCALEGAVQGMPRMLGVFCESLASRPCYTPALLACYTHLTKRRSPGAELLVVPLPAGNPVLGQAGPLTALAVAPHGPLDLYRALLMAMGWLHKAKGLDPLTSALPRRRDLPPSMPQSRPPPGSWQDSVGRAAHLAQQLLGRLDTTATRQRGVQAQRQGWQQAQRQALLPHFLEVARVVTSAVQPSPLTRSRESMAALAAFAAALVPAEAGPGNGPSRPVAGPAAVAGNAPAEGGESSVPAGKPAGGQAEEVQASSAARAQVGSQFASIGSHKIFQAPEALGCRLPCMHGSALWGARPSLLAPAPCFWDFQPSAQSEIG